MAELEIMGLDEAMGECKAPQGTDEYVAKKKVTFEEDVIFEGLINGRDPVADAAALDTAVQPAALGSAAASDTTDFAPAASGDLANSSLQPADVGTAAYADVVDFATAAQGAKADAAKVKTDFITITQAVDLDAIEARVNSLDAAVVLKGLWDASAGTFPGGGTAQPGWSYIVSVAGTVGGIVFDVNDRIIALVTNASTTVYAANWFKLDYTDAVLSVNGVTGAVTVATVAQGALADTALQPGSSVPAGDPSITNKRLPLYEMTVGITAFATGGQTNAILLTTEYNVVNTVATAGDSIKLPVAAVGQRIVVTNRGANALNLFPNVSDVIEALAVDTAISVPAAGKIALFCSDDTIWYEE